MQQSTSTKRRFIIDTDAGCDDAVAILLLLSKIQKGEPFEVVAFTAVQGNVNVNQVTQNIGRLLDIAGSGQIPFYKGAAEPIIGKHMGCLLWEGHGKDGLGDVFSLPPSTRQPETEHASSAIIRLVNAHPNELTLVMLGPMTNMAIAIKLDPSVGSKFKEVFFIGGSMEGRGNQTMVGEFNIHTDPEAADIALSSMTSPITMISWELTEHNTLPWSWYEEWLKLEHHAKMNKTLEQIMALTAKFSQSSPSWPVVEPGMNICDAVCMAVALHPDIITKSEERFIAVELGGAYSRGLTCIDWYNILKRKPNVRIVLSINHARYKEILKGMFT